MAELYGGVETGGTWCVCAVGTGPENVVAHERFRTGEPAATLDRIVQFFTRQDAVAAVGVGSFGPVDLNPDSPTWGHVTTTPKHGWRHTPVAPVLRDRLGVAVAFDTDVNAAALGEYRWGAGRGAPSLCYLTIGTGIGAGVVIAGEPWHGLVHPEVGHLRIPHDRQSDRFPGACPSHGDCWEGLASGEAMAERWQIAPEQLAENHPGWTLEADYLALGIVSIITVLSPHRIIVGGGVMRQPLLLAMVRRGVRDRLADYLEAPLLGDEIDDYLVSPGLGDRSGVLGAIALAAAAPRR